MISLIYGIGRNTRPAQRQSAVIALSIAVLAAIAGAALWGLIVMLTKHQFSLVGVVIGAGVGTAVARFRAAHWPTIVTGAVIAVAGCALGTALGMIFTALNQQVPLSYLLGHLSQLFHYYPRNVGALGLVFWAIAAFAAIRIPLQSQRMSGRRQPPYPAGMAGQPIDVQPMADPSSPPQ